MDLPLVLLKNTKIALLYEYTPLWASMALGELHDSWVNLHSSRVSLHSSRVSLHSSRVSLHSSRVSLQSSRVSLHSSRVSSMAPEWAPLPTSLLLWLQDEPPRLQGEFHGSRLSLDGSWVSLQSYRFILHDSRWDPLLQGTTVVFHHTKLCSELYQAAHSVRT